MRACWNRWRSSSDAGPISTAASGASIPASTAGASNPRTAAGARPATIASVSRSNWLPIAAAVTSSSRVAAGGVPGLGGQLAELAREQVGDVLGDPGALDRGDAEAERAGARVERDAALVVQGLDELADEQRVALGLAPDQRGRVGDLVGRDAERVGDQRDGLVPAERGERDPRQLCAALLVVAHRERERV